MKTTVINLSLLMVLSNSQAQFYERTGRNIGIYMTSSPFSSVQTRGETKRFNSWTLGGGMCHMLIPGVFPYAGYRYTAPSPLFTDENSLRPFHSVHAGVLLDKHLTKVRQRKIGSQCHYHALGIILGPEYQHAIGQRGFGELAGQIGLSIYHRVSGASKRNRGNTIQYDFFYRHGFTPILNSESIQTYTRQIGLRIRYTKHQVFNFLE